MSRRFLVFVRRKYSFMRKLEAEFGDLALAESYGSREVADSPVR